MSYQDDDIPQEQQEAQQNQQAVAQGVTPVLSGGGSTGGNKAVGSPAAPNAPSASQTAPTSSGSWTDLNAYLNANQDNTANMATGITNSVNNDINNATNDLNVNTANSDAAQYQNAITNGSDNTFNQDQINAALANPTDATNASYLESQLGATYNGPTAFGSTGPNDTTDTNSSYYTAAQNLENNATNEANELQTENGRYGFLQNWANQNNGNDQYSQGMAGLDNMLLQNTPNAQSQIAGLNNNAANMQGTFNSDVGNLNSLASTAASNTASDASNTSQALQGAISGLNTTMGNEVTANQQRFNNIQSEMQNDQPVSTSDLAWATNGQMTEAQYNALLLQDQMASVLAQVAGNNGAPVSPASGLTAPTFNVSNSATPDQIAQYNALNTILNNPTSVASTNFGNTFNTQNAQNAINSSTQASNNYLQQHPQPTPPAPTPGAPNTGSPAYNGTVINLPLSTGFSNTLDQDLQTNPGGLLGTALTGI